MLATYSNLNHTDTGVYVLKSGFALGAYAGKTIRLQFRATTDEPLGLQDRSVGKQPVLAPGPRSPEKPVPLNWKWTVRED